METQKSRIQKSDEFCQQEQEIQQQKFINNIRKLLGAQDAETREIGVQLLLCNRNLIAPTIGNRQYSYALTQGKIIKIDENRTLVIGNHVIFTCSSEIAPNYQII